MLKQSYKYFILCLILIVISFSIILNNYKSHLSLIICDNRRTINETNNYTIANETKKNSLNVSSTSSPSSSIHPMFKDPEVNACYSLKSFSMPEDIFNLNAIAVNRPLLNASSAPTQVTFNEVHTILYGDPSSKLIYQSYQKYINKTKDHSYPHTNIKLNDFLTIIQRINPKLKLQFMVEVGSFTGNSATLMGNILKNFHPGSFLLCIDTWLGDLNMWVNKVVWEHLSVSEDGRPTVYYQFLANMVAENLTRVVLPVSMSSIIGARFLNTYQYRPQLIYLDSAHEQGETLIELALYWNILQAGGVLFGDDWGWISVRCDVKKFAYMRNLTIEHLGLTWLLKKPLE